VWGTGTGKEIAKSTKKHQKKKHQQKKTYFSEKRATEFF